MGNEEFIKAIAPIIQREAKARGYKVCSPIIAQACLESAYGRSGLSAKYHNYFGLKCGSSWKGKSVNMKTQEEYTVGSLTTIRDNFRAYDSMEDGVKGYFDFISTKRYANLKDASSPREYLELIKADGYATSSKYVDSNMNVLARNNLEKYDDPKYSDAATYFPKYTGTTDSISQALSNVGADNSFSYRQQIALANGIVTRATSYMGSATQNIYMLNLLKAGKLKRP